MRVKSRTRIFTTVDLSAALDMADYTLLIDVANYVVITMLIIFIFTGLASIDLQLTNLEPLLGSTHTAQFGQRFLRTTDLEI